MRIGITFKFWFFKHYWWLVCLLIIAAVAFLVFRNEPLPTVATVVGALLSLVYFLQKQKLEEIRLFRELFKEFNERYDGMNEELAAIVEGKDLDLTGAQKSTLIDYFNLCGEEYLYFLRGYIDPDVWQAWENGMKTTISTPRVYSLWVKEKDTGSYYGLPL